MAAPPPLTGAFVMIYDPRDESLPKVGCLAVIEKFGRKANGNLASIIARSTQRCRIIEGATLPYLNPTNDIPSVTIEILPERIPRCSSDIRNGFSHFPYWTFRPIDPSFLAHQIMTLLPGILEGIEFLKYDPVQLSYKLASFLPIECNERQRLLEENCVVNRLRRELEIVSSMRQIFCHRCSQFFAVLDDIIVVSETDSGVFVNAGGHLHDILLLKAVQNGEFDDTAHAEFSWFPGYAWSIAYCGRCDEHIGWRFISLREDVRPNHFWALSQSQISYKGEERENEQI